MTFEIFLRLLKETYDTPQDMARRVISWQLTRGEAMLALALAAVLTTLLTLLPALILPVEDASFAMLIERPLLLALFQFLGNLLAAALLVWVGRLFKGEGTWRQGLALMAWMQLVFSVLQAAQILLTLALPFLALPVALFVIFSFFFLFSHFAAALHGFRSVGLVLLGVIGTMVVLAIVLGLLLVLLVPVPHV